VTADGLAGPEAEGPLLDTFALVTTTEGAAPKVKDAAGKSRVRDGLLVAVLGDLDTQHAEAVAALRHGHASALGLVLDPFAWASRASDSEHARAGRTASLLTAAGWRVGMCDPRSDLAHTWRTLARAGVTAGGAR
jgi:hypothetical protein